MAMYHSVPKDIYGSGLLQVVPIPKLICICIYFSLMMITVNAHIYYYMCFFPFFLYLFNTPLLYMPTWMLFPNTISVVTCAQGLSINYFSHYLIMA